MPVKYKNNVLHHMDYESIHRLQLRPVELEVRHEIEYPGRAIRHLFFIEEGAASMTVTLRDGSQVEAGMFGCESVIGISALMGTRQSLNRVYMQIAGRGYTCSTELGRLEFDRGGVFHALSLRYVQAQLTMSAQSAACNVKHDVEQRLARWLLICADRINTGDYAISQEFLADMLGISRPSVSIAAGLLKTDGLIDYSRGVIHILNVPALEERSCECYRAVKDHLNSLLEFDMGFRIKAAHVAQVESKPEWPGPSPTQPFKPL